MSSTNYKFTRHDFIDGEILEAEHLNNLEEAIEQLFYGLENIDISDRVQTQVTTIVETQMTSDRLINEIVQKVTNSILSQEW